MYIFINLVWIYFVIKTAGKIQKTAAYYGTIIGGFTFSILQFVCGFILYHQLAHDEKELPTKNAFRVGKI